MKSIIRRSLPAILTIIAAGCLVLTGMQIGLVAHAQMQTVHSPPKPDTVAREWREDFLRHAPDIGWPLLVGTCLLIYERRLRSH